MRFARIFSTIIMLLCSSEYRTHTFRAPGAVFFNFHSQGGLYSREVFIQQGGLYSFIQGGLYSREVFILFNRGGFILSSHQLLHSKTLVMTATGLVFKRWFYFFICAGVTNLYLRGGSAYYVNERNGVIATRIKIIPLRHYHNYTDHCTCKS